MSRKKISQPIRKAKSNFLNSVNGRNGRNKVYNQSFMKQPVERRLSTFEQITIESTLAIHKFGNQPTEQSLNNLCEMIGDLETMIEVFENTFEGVRDKINATKKAKLEHLKKISTEQVEKEAAKKKEQASKDEATKKQFQESAKSN